MTVMAAKAFFGDEGPSGRRVSAGDAAGSGESAVLLVSVDNSDIATSTTPTLTSVTNPGAELANRASRILLRLIEDGVAPGEVAPEVIRPALVVRASG
ncbi:MAG: substrate-binding domain-containing protein [Propionibacteriaceae bacterium]|jgi:DNA-binding LacI/PurR family transcriptional regulator|nr:substrate-binding domain-containing protein [Propionibacteriaceae bacterium]